MKGIVLAGGSGRQIYSTTPNSVTEGFDRCHIAFTYKHSNEFTAD